MNQQWIQDVHTRANKATLGPWCNVKEQSEIIGTCFKVNQRFLDTRIGKTQKLLSDALFTIGMGGALDD